MAQLNPAERWSNFDQTLYGQTREQTLKLCHHLEIEDYVIQTHPDVSPLKWHLAHTTWFFERFILREFAPEFKAFDSSYDHLFNSYYETLGKYHDKPSRGHLSRPTVDEILSYRSYVDSSIETLLQSDIQDKHKAEVLKRLEIGINHEQQHQELILMDLKFNFSRNPIFPAYQEKKVSSVDSESLEFKWVKIEANTALIGSESIEDFCYDNELPRHQVIVRPFSIANRLVTNEEYLKFVEEGAYQKPELWLSDAWAWINENKISAPEHWFFEDGRWQVFQLTGLEDLVPYEPVSHLSFYEADAYTRWTGYRMPSEFEWEYAARNHASGTTYGNFLDSGKLRPQPPDKHDPSPLKQMAGDLWEWTRSPYLAYPGYRSYPGSLGEYNSKFMCNQWVLRGGSYGMTASHYRHTYRNFYYPHHRWMFSGIRLVKDEF